METRDVLPGEKRRVCCDSGAELGLVKAQIQTVVCYGTRNFPHGT